MIQMWITPISSSSRSAAVTAEAIEVDSKSFKSIHPLKLKYSSVTRASINKTSLHTLFIIRVKIFLCNKF